MAPKKPSTPFRYDHDCPDCVHLGQYGDADLYWCAQQSFPTVIARYGDELFDYTSGLAAADANDDLREARARAASRRLDVGGAA